MINDDIFNGTDLHDIHLEPEVQYEYMFIVEITTSIADRTSKANVFQRNFNIYTSKMEAMFDNVFNDSEMQIYGKNRKMNDNVLYPVNLIHTEDSIFDDYYIFVSTSGRLANCTDAANLISFILSDRNNIHIMQFGIFDYTGRQTGNYIEKISSSNGWVSYRNKALFQLSKHTMNCIMELNSHHVYLFLSCIEYFMLVCVDNPDIFIRYMKRKEIPIQNCFNDVNISWRLQTGTMSPVVRKDKFRKLRNSDNIKIAVAPLNYTNSGFPEFEFHPLKKHGRVRAIRNSGSMLTSMTSQTSPEIENFRKLVNDYDGNYTLLYTGYSDMFSSKKVDDMVRLYLVLSDTAVRMKNAFGKETYCIIALVIDFKPDLSDMEDGLDIVERLTGLSELSEIKENIQENVER